MKPKAEGCPDSTGGSRRPPGQGAGHRKSAGRPAPAPGRSRLELELRRAHSELERRVRQRTAELERIVKLLQAEVFSRHQAERHIQGIASLLELFAVKAQRQDYLEAVARLLRQWARCGGAGVRLFDQQGALPFAAHVGFQREFLGAEGRLQVRADPCPCLRVLNHRPRLEDVPWMNIRGSIYCNQMDHCRPAGRPASSPCARARYASIAQVPIHFRDRVIGAIHLADRKPGRFNAGIIEFLEAIAPLIGEALHRFTVEGQLRESEQHFRSMFERHEIVMLLVEPGSRAIVDANPAAERFYGHTRARLCALGLGGLNSLAPTAAERRRAFPPDRSFGVCHHRLASGEIRTVEVHASPVTEAGRKLLFLIIHDITERMRLEKQILDISDQERKRVGQDLHDSLGGSLTGLALLSKALAQVLREQANPQAEIAEEIVAGINHAVGQTRSIARGLCPVELGAFGLTSGLRELAAATEKRCRVACRFRAAGEARVGDELTASHLFRIAQEAVANAVRHGKARRVSIELAARKEGLRLAVRDDGVGFAKELLRSQGMGLNTMRYRAEVIGAQLELKSAPGRGTMVACLVPAGAVGGQPGQQPKPL